MSQTLSTSRYDEYLSHIHDILLETHVFKSYLTELFYSNANRVEIMNDSASTFFVMCENSFVESIIMRISKVTDPETTGGVDKLTIKTLFKQFFSVDHSEDDLVQQTLDTLEAQLKTLKKKPKSRNLTITSLFKHFFSEDDPEYELVKQKLEKLAAQIKNLRLRRNKQLGHIDLKSLGKEFPISLANIDNALSLLEEIFNHIVRKLPEGLENFKPDAQPSFKPEGQYSGDAVAALIMLEKGRRYDALIEQLPEDCLHSLLPSSGTWLERGIFPGIERHYFEDDVIRFVYSEGTHESG